jgi:hypothetical protein
MEHRSLNFKYWVEFDDEGEIKSFHRTKYDCESPCEEYVVKLIPIKRDVGKELEQSVDKFAKELTKKSKILDTEFKKAIKTVKGVLK